MLVPRLLVSIESVAPPPPPPPTLSASFGTCFTPGDGGGYIRITYTVNNPVGGEYIEVSYDVTAGDPITTTGPGGPVGPFTASPADVNVALGTNAAASADVYLRDSLGGLLDTVNLPNGILPI